MELEPLLQRLGWVRRFWTVTAATIGLLYLCIIPIYLYAAFVQYLLVTIGPAAYTGLNGTIVNRVVHSTGLAEMIISLLRLVVSGLWLIWLWFAFSFAHKATQRLVFKPQEDGLERPAEIETIATEKPLRIGPWLAVIGWVVPVLNIIFIPWIMIALARATRGPLDENVVDAAPGAHLGAPAAEGSSSGNTKIHGTTWSALAIALLSALANVSAYWLNKAPAEDFADPLKGQSLLHLAATSGILVLLMLLAMDAYLIRLTRLQELRLARRRLMGH